MNIREAVKTLNEVLGSHKKVSKNEYYFKCPACDHHKHKFAINLDKNAFHCWICDYRGRSVRRIIRRFGSFTQLQVWDRLSDQINLAAFDTLFDQKICEPETILNLPNEFMSLANQKMFHYKMVRLVLNMFSNVNILFLQKLSHEDQDRQGIDEAGHHRARDEAHQ